MVSIFELGKIDVFLDGLLLRSKLSDASKFVDIVVKSGRCEAMGGSWWRWNTC